MLVPTHRDWILLEECEWFDTIVKEGTNIDVTGKTCSVLTLFLEMWSIGICKFGNNAVYAMLH